MKTLALLAVLLSRTAAAQTPEPAEEPTISSMPSGTGTPNVAPANVSTGTVQSAEKPAEADDSPIGLFIMPWRDSAAEKDIDRPARLLQAEMAPIDPIVFERQVEYYDALDAHANKTANAGAKH